MNQITSGFLIGVITTASFAVAGLFLKYWNRTRDTLFLAFALAFFIEAFNRIPLLFSQHPNEGSPWYYVVRLISFLIILGGIVKKNYGR
jgi:uncharacterized membrane protein HdeD (DUF308 family)